LFKYIKNNPNTFLGSEMKDIEQRLTKILKKETFWGRKVEEITGEYYWDFEESTAIRTMLNKDKMYSELKLFIIQIFPDIDRMLVDDIIRFQQYVIKDPYQTYPKKVPFNFNLKDILYESKPIKNNGYTYQFDSENYNNDVKEWCTRTIWWGRRNREYEVTVSDA
jgi:hypothetical protein